MDGSATVWIMGSWQTDFARNLTKEGHAFADLTAEVHDRFTPSQYLAIDHIGLTGPGESWKAIENGEIEIGVGHPVGVWGVRILLDAAKQVSGAAGEYQLDGPRPSAPSISVAAPPPR